ncbi:uncharacterized protein BX664DRAFT_389420 [Halteromyces radiatus]|uniref:uncharacterized protein n=1 Tax=Halteromyces radiatus TaxID=101107 RepID=UPI00221F43E3|nr:uncharacterized protein BX664DRAFT_389420 [Halteromyces radiatus]KAI8077832.1 hypothetical protein BX664DRAFT_389420 [Halteromyces radiatus]
MTNIETHASTKKQQLLTAEKQYIDLLNFIDSCFKTEKEASFQQWISSIQDLHQKHQLFYKKLGQENDLVDIMIDLGNTLETSYLDYTKMYSSVRQHHENLLCTTINKNLSSIPPSYTTSTLLDAPFEHIKLYKSLYISLLDSSDSIQHSSIQQIILHIDTVLKQKPPSTIDSTMTTNLLDFQKFVDCSNVIDLFTGSSLDYQLRSRPGVIILQDNFLLLADNNDQPAIRVYLVLTSDILMICNQKSESTGRYELLYPPLAVNDITVQPLFLDRELIGEYTLEFSVLNKKLVVRAESREIRNAWIGMPLTTTAKNAIRSAIPLTNVARASTSSQPSSIENKGNDIKSNYQPIIYSNSNSNNNNISPVEAPDDNDDDDNDDDEDSDGTTASTPNSDYPHSLTEKSLPSVPSHPEPPKKDFATPVINISLHDDAINTVQPPPKQNQPLKPRGSSIRAPLPNPAYKPSSPKSTTLESKPLPRTSSIRNGTPVSESSNQRSQPSPNSPVVNKSQRPIQQMNHPQVAPSSSRRGTSPSTNGIPTHPHLHPSAQHAQNRPMMMPSPQGQQHQQRPPPQLHQQSHQRPQHRPPPQHHHHHSQQRPPPQHHHHHPPQQRPASQHHHPQQRPSHQPHHPQQRPPPQHHHPQQRPPPQHHHHHPQVRPSPQHHQPQQRPPTPQLSQQQVQQSAVTTNVSKPLPQTGASAQRHMPPTPPPQKSQFSPSNKETQPQLSTTPGSRDSIGSALRLSPEELATPPRSPNPYNNQTNGIRQVLFRSLKCEVFRWKDESWYAVDGQCLLEVRQTFTNRSCIAIRVQTTGELYLNAWVLPQTQIRVASPTDVSLGLIMGSQQETYLVHFEQPTEATEFNQVLQKMHQAAVLAAQQPNDGQRTLRGEPPTEMMLAMQMNDDDDNDNDDDDDLGTAVTTLGSNNVTPSRTLTRTSSLMQSGQEPTPIPQTLQAVMQCKCKLFVQNEHSNWSSFGSVQLVVSLQIPSRRMHIQIDHDKKRGFSKIINTNSTSSSSSSRPSSPSSNSDKSNSLAPTSANTLVSATVYSNNVERLGSKRISFLLVNEQDRTSSMVYMVQLRDEESGNTLHDYLKIKNAQNGW